MHKNIPVSAVLVRKDLALVSSKPGKPRLGFEVVRLIADIEKFLGYDNLSDAVIVGAGGLGKAFWDTRALRATDSTSWLPSTSIPESSGRKSREKSVSHGQIFGFRAA
ncbi:MAG: hypothetical protein ACLR06_06755 [Christensenellaceae bacterium]